MKTTICDLNVDIWLEIFEYFNAIELLTSFIHVTRTVDELLLNKNQYVYFRQLILDVDIKNILEKLHFDQIMSLELHEETSVDIVDKCLKLRSLKLIGQPEWMIFILKRNLHVKMNLKRLILVLPGIQLLPMILSSFPAIFTIHRLEIYANELEQKMSIDSCFPAQINVEQFVLDTFLSMGSYELAYLLSTFYTIHFLSITLFYDNRLSLPLPILPNLQYIHLKLFEVPFEWIINLVGAAPILSKLKLSGLVNNEGFVINQQWIRLFRLCPSLITVIVNVSLQNDSYVFCNEMARRFLQDINLDLSTIDDDSDIFLCEMNQQKWFKLSGTIFRNNIDRLKNSLY